MSVWGSPVCLGGGGGVIQPLSVTANGTYTAPSGVVGYSPVTVSVPAIRGFELYGATFDGGTQTFHGINDNMYMACGFHDNMRSYYKLNGVTKNFTQSRAAVGIAQICGTTVPVSGNTQIKPNAILSKGSEVVSYHDDSGSYMSVVGGWVGWPSGGTIYENVSASETNSITMNSAHSKLLFFAAASNTTLGSATTISINGVTYNITNMGQRYDSVYSIYAAIEIDSNSDTVITVTFPAICYNYVSIIGLD